MSTVSIISEVETPQGKKKQKSYTNISPNATNKQLSDFAIVMNALTDNRYGTTYKIEKTNVDTESGDTRPVPTFELFANDYTTPLTDNQLSITKNANNIFGFKTNSDGMIYVPILGLKVDMFWRDAENANGVKGFFINTGDYYEAGETADVVIKTEETENFKAGSVTLHVTVTA